MAVLFTVMIILLGLSTLSTIKKDMWPEVELGELFITTRYPGASPEDVELNVTNNDVGQPDFQFWQGRIVKYAYNSF